MLKQLTLAAFAAAALVGAVSNAYAGLTTTPGWGCYNCGYKNGRQLTGIPDGSAPSTGDVSAVILPSGEAVDLR